MVRQDILAVLRNAVERGYSLEQARNTMINSGYNANDVNEAVAYFTGGLAGGVQQQIQPVESINLGKQSQPQTQTEEKPKKKFPWVVVLLSTFLIVLVIVLVLVLVFKDQVSDFLQKLF